MIDLLWWTSPRVGQVLPNEDMCEKSPQVPHKTTLIPEHNSVVILDIAHV